MLLPFTSLSHILQTVDVGHTDRLTGVVYTDGGIFTCSTDNMVKVVDPVLEPSIIADLTSHTAPVARVSCIIRFGHINLLYCLFGKGC